MNGKVVVLDYTNGSYQIVDLEDITVNLKGTTLEREVDKYLSQYFKGCEISYLIVDKEEQKQTDKEENKKKPDYTYLRVSQLEDFKEYQLYNSQAYFIMKIGTRLILRYNGNLTSFQVSAYFTASFKVVRNYEAHK